MDTKNFKTLVVAGLGSIGWGMFAVGRRYLRDFSCLVAVDREPGKQLPPRVDGVELLTGDVMDQDFLDALMRRLPAPVLFVNLCSGLDNVRLRSALAKLPVAYLDSSCCAPDDGGEVEYRLSRRMPYTMTQVESAYPHWVCWGVNPGMVELIARLLLEKMDIPAAQADVSIFEHDGLFVHNDRKRPVVGWCPAALVEEMLCCHPLVVEKHNVWDGTGNGGVPALTRWGGIEVPAWVVGNEDIWNLGRLLGVKAARFLYGLPPAVMRILESRDAASAHTSLQVPTPATAVGGLERVAVRVYSSVSGVSQTLLWETDHGKTWKRLGVNAVQYQTCLSLWFAVRILQHTPYGTRRGTWCASNLPFSKTDWGEIERGLASMQILWEKANHLDLRLDIADAGKWKNAAIR